MTRKEVVQNQLDVYNSVLSSVVIGGLVGMILLIIKGIQDPRNPWFMIVAFVGAVGLGIIGFQCISKRRKLLLELTNMP